jgi:hypothetical protein
VPAAVLVVVVPISLVVLLYARLVEAEDIECAVGFGGIGCEKGEW